MATWPTITDRNVQFPNRVLLDGTTLHTVAPSPGTITDAGTPINAALMASIKSYIDSQLAAKQTEIDSTNATVTTLNTSFNNMAWSYLGSTSGTATISLPTDFTEIHVTTRYNSEPNSYVASLNIPRVELVVGGAVFQAGEMFTTGGFTTGCRWVISTTSANQAFMLLNTATDATDNCTSYWYIRR